MNVAIRVPRPCLRRRVRKLRTSQGVPSINPALPLAIAEKDSHPASDDLRNLTSLVNISAQGCHPGEANQAGLGNLDLCSRDLARFRRQWFGTTFGTPGCLVPWSMPGTLQEKGRPHGRYP